MEKVRVYQFEKMEWLLIYDTTTAEEPVKYNTWLIDIDGADMMAFVLPEGQT
jgi:hypothetical protein